jgi:hypothetical protein
MQSCPCNFNAPQRLPVRPTYLHLTMSESQQQMVLLSLPEEIIIQIISHIFSGPCILDLDIAQPPHTVALQSVSILSASSRLHGLGEKILRENFTRSGLHVYSITPRPNDSGEDKLLSFLRQYGDCFRDVSIIDAATRDDTFLKRLLCFPNLERLTFTGKELEINHTLDADDEVCRSGVLSVERVRKLCGPGAQRAVQHLTRRCAQLETWGLQKWTYPGFEGWVIEGLEERKGRFSIALDVLICISSREAEGPRAVGRWVCSFWCADLIVVG